MFFPAFDFVLSPDVMFKLEQEVSTLLARADRKWLQRSVDEQNLMEKVWDKIETGDTFTQEQLGFLFPYFVLHSKPLHRTARRLLRDEGSKTDILKPLFTASDLRHMLAAKITPGVKK